METVTGIGFKKKDRWRRVASSIALVVKLTAMLEAWWVAFKSLEVRTNPVGVPHRFTSSNFFFFFYLFIFFLTVKKPQNEKKVKKRSSEVSPLIFRYYEELYQFSTCNGLPVLQIHY